MKRIGAVLVLSLATSCSHYPATAPAPGPIDSQTVDLATQRWEGTTAESLEEGRLLFVENCGYCHDHPDIHAFPPEKWPHEVEEMGREQAKISAREIDLITRFVQAELLR